MTAGENANSAAPSSTGKYIARICPKSPASPRTSAAVCHCSSRLCVTAMRHSAVAAAVSDTHASYGSSHSRMNV